MTRLLRAELVKLTSVTSNRVLLILIVALGIGFGVLVCGIVPIDDLRDQGPLDTDTSFQLAMGGFSVAASLVAVLGIQLLAQDLRFTARLTFAAEPRRTRIIVGKTLAMIGFALVTAVLVVGGSLLACVPVLRARDLPFDWSTPGLFRAIVGAVIVMVLYGLLGLGMAAILRSAVAAIPALIVWSLIVEGALSALVPEVTQYAPFTAAAQVMMIAPEEPTLGPWLGAAWATFVAMLLLVIGTVLTNRRDI
jgi:hypothetical protein